MSSKKRKYTPSPQLQVNRLPIRSRTPSPDSGLANVGRSMKGLFERITGNDDSDSAANPVVNGATPPRRRFLRNLFKDMSSQEGRFGDNYGLLASFAETKLFQGGLIDDRQYQIEQVLQLAASLPPQSHILKDLSGEFIKVLWENIEHPPISYQGYGYRYRMADGSNNNIMYPHLGAAGSSYARTVTPQTLQPGVLPDPGLIFDTVFAAGGDRREHPSKISSMLFYLATVIVHDIFHTDETDYQRLKTSSYLDLAPLYGSSQAEQDLVRAHADGLLKPDTYSESRVLGFPPGVSALLICFNRYHNYIALQLKTINEGGRFNLPSSTPSKEDLKKLDDDLFQTARLVTCGLYINIVLHDYVRTILNLNRTNSSWTVDPRDNNAGDVFNDHGVPVGVGNQVSVEFNLIYRWHSAISVKDECWTSDSYKELFPKQDINKLTEEELIAGLRKRAMDLNPDPSKWTLDNGKYQRNSLGRFEDTDLVEILSDATEDVACAFGPRNIPVVMKLIETLGIKQARKWRVATLNEFRKFFKLEPHRHFSDITKNEEVARSLKSLYTHPDYVELYPGLVAEDAKEPLEPGSGLCPGFTVSRTILSDAVALTRGDRFYTVDYTPANLTNWGWNQVNSDPEVAGGGVIYNLLMRALPFWYRGNSVYAMFPFVVPDENRQILRTLNKDREYDFQRPSYQGVPITVRTWKGVTDVLSDQSRFLVPWGAHTGYLTHHNYMLSGDTLRDVNQKVEVSNAIYCPVNGLDEIRQFYEDLTTQLVEIRSEHLRDQLYQLDAIRDVANPSHAIFVARMFHLPLKAPGDLNPIGVTVDDLYLGLSILFAYVFLDLDTARSFKLRSAAKQATDQIARLVKIVCEAVRAGKHLHLSHLFSLGSAGKLLQDYGRDLIQRLFDRGKSVDEVVYTIIPTAAAAAATQAQQFSQMLDFYLRDDYKDHWPAIQACALSNDPADFEKLKSYALEANRLAPAAFGLLRKCKVATEVGDGTDKTVHLKPGDQLYADFVAAGLDPLVFPNPLSIDLSRNRSLYIHHGWGAHSCLGRPIVEVAMAAQLKVFAKLKNLRRAPGLQGEIKKITPSPNPEGSEPQKTPGTISVFMKEDWSDLWPFPCTMKVHHDGFVANQDEHLKGQTGLPHVDSAVAITVSNLANGSPTRPRDGDGWHMEVDGISEEQADKGEETKEQIVEETETA